MELFVQQTSLQKLFNVLYKEPMMHCPVCKDPQLVISERQGIEIDYCPSCRGVWLDRGELDKLIEKSNVMNQPSPVSSYQQRESQPRMDDRYHSDSRHYYQKKPKNWLSEFFD